MLLAILDDEDSIAFRILKMLGADISGLVSALDEEIGFSEEEDRKSTRLNSSHSI